MEFFIPSIRRTIEMTRPLRIEFPDAIYHVNYRGNNRQAIFFSDEDREMHLERTRETVLRYGWRMFAFCQMTNHAHHYFQTPEPNLSAGMQFLLSGFARRVNASNGLCGHLLQGRFHDQLVENETYSFSVSRYIHLNPYRTQPPMVVHPFDWPWSSYPGYVDPTRRLDWIDYDVVLNSYAAEFGGDPVAGYRSYVEQGITEPPANPFKQAIDGWILGSQTFAAWLAERFSLDRSCELPRRRTFVPFELDRLTQILCGFYGVNNEAITTRRSQHIVRPLFAWFARRVTRCTRKQIAIHLSLKHSDSVSTMLRRIDKQRDASTSLRSDIEAIEMLLNVSHAC